MRLILTRHGETEDNVKEILQGQAGGKLTAKGIEQAKKLALRLKKEKIDKIYVSDLKRAVDTAKELHAYLKAEKLFNPKGNIKNSEFYISVANKDNTNTIIDKDGRFPYDYKYGRSANEIQEYVLRNVDTF